MEFVMMNGQAWWRRATTGLAALSLVGVVACSQQTEDKAAQTGEAAKDTAASAADDAARATERAAEATREAAAEGSEKARETGEAIAERTREAGQKADATLDKAARVGDAAQQTLDIKSALVADSRVTATRIDVDTDAKLKLVTLKGSVPNAAQRKTAEEIAMSKAPGYRVKNDLTIVP
jgi:osmotically-inducible protein OsmY